MVRIDDLDSFSRYEPEPAISGLCNPRTVPAGRCRAESDTVGRVQYAHFNRALRICDPRVYFRPGDAYKTASGVQPERMIVVFHRPENGVARQSVPACERRDVTILNSVQDALGGNP